MNKTRCPCGLDTCTETWEPGCGLGLDMAFAEVAPEGTEAAFATPPESAQGGYVLVHKRDLIEQDSYGVHGSEFYRCRVCGCESGAGILNKGIEHGEDCPLAASPEPPAAAECCRTAPCRHPGVGPCDMPVKPAAQEGEVKGALRLLEQRIAWLRRFSDEGQHRRLHGPSAGDAFDLSMELEDIAALIHRLSQPVGEVDGAKSPSYDALLLIAQSVCGALERAGLTDCDDPGEAIDVIRERLERRIAELEAASFDAEAVAWAYGKLRDFGCYSSETGAQWGDRLNLMLMQAPLRTASSEGRP